MDKTVNWRPETCLQFNVDSCNKKVIYTNEHHLITLQFPFILNIKKYFHIFCRLIPSLNWGQVLSIQLIVYLVF